MPRNAWRRHRFDFIQILDKDELENVPYGCSKVRFICIRCQVAELTLKQYNNGKLCVKCRKNTGG